MGGSRKRYWVRKEGDGWREEREGRTFAARYSFREKCCMRLVGVPRLPTRLLASNALLGETNLLPWITSSVNREVDT